MCVHKEKAPKWKIICYLFSIFFLLQAVCSSQLLCFLLFFNYSACCVFSCFFFLKYFFAVRLYYSGASSFVHNFICYTRHELVDKIILIQYTHTPLRRTSQSLRQNVPVNPFPSPSFPVPTALCHLMTLKPHHSTDARSTRRMEAEKKCTPTRALYILRDIHERFTVFQCKALLNNALYYSVSLTIGQ